MSTDVLAFDGYDPASPTLQRSPLIGNCMRSWLDARKWTCSIADPVLPCRSGDLVRLLVRNRDGAFRWMVKWLRATRSGAWFAVCDDAAFRLGWGGPYWPIAINRIVALSTFDYGLERDAPVDGASPAELAQFNSSAATVRAVGEWQEQGWAPGTPFPGLVVVNPKPSDRSRMDDHAARLLEDLPLRADDLRNGTGLPVCATVGTPSYDQPVAPTNLTAIGFVKGVLLKWDAPSPRNSRQVYHVYQHTANTPFGSATRVWSGNTLHTTIDLVAGVTRFFWVTGELNGVETAAVPVGNGVSGTPAPAGTDDLEGDAATDPFVLVEPADGSQVFSATTQPAIEPSGISGLASYTSPATRSTEVKVSWAVQARISNLTSGTAVGTSTVRVAVTINGSTVWDSIMTIEAYNGTDDWATFSGSRDFTVPAGQQIQVFLNSGRVFTTGGASPAQTHFWQNALLNLKAAKA